MKIARVEMVVLLLIYTFVTTPSMLFFKYKFVIATESNHVFAWGIVYIISVFSVLVFQVYIEKYPITKLMDILLVLLFSFYLFWIQMLIDIFIFEPIFIK